MKRSIRLKAHGLLVAAALISLSACGSVGFSGRDAELNRAQGRTGLALISFKPDAALFLARNREVVVTPAAGLCLDRSAIEVRRDSAFMLLADCPVSVNAASLDANGNEAIELSLPPSFPGLTTISIAAEPLVENGEDTDSALARLRAFLGSPGGRKALSRENTRASEVIETREIGDALYVLAQEDLDGGGFLAPRYWRSFVELNGRLTIVTVSALAETTVGSDEMMAHLARQTAELRDVNGETVAREELRLASAVPEADHDRKALVRRTVKRSAPASGPPSNTPSPPSNPRIVAVKAVQPVSVPQTKPGATAAVGTIAVAPAYAPIAPRRPRA